MLLTQMRHYLIEAHVFNLDAFICLIISHFTFSSFHHFFSPKMCIPVLGYSFLYAHVYS
uniref:Uncharacterized protein n=1 Tax=Rhizophora mucronata TaxID=61149 RepID=A0A2P2NKP1_RHIMU